MLNDSPFQNSLFKATKLRVIPTSPDALRRAAQTQADNKAAE